MVTKVQFLLDLLIYCIFTYLFAKMSKETTLAIVAIVAAFGLVGALAIETLILPQQQAEARSPVGACASFLRNASSQICHNFR
jgi:hypothetical protein